MPRGKRTRANTRATTTARRTTRAAAGMIYDSSPSTGSPNHHCAASATTSPTTCPNGLHTAFLHLIRNEVRAELDAQRVAVGALPVATQSQDPQEPVTSPLHPLGPQQHPSQQISPTGMSQQ